MIQVDVQNNKPLMIAGTAEDISIEISEILFAYATKISSKSKVISNADPSSDSFIIALLDAINPLILNAAMIAIDEKLSEESTGTTINMTKFRKVLDMLQENGSDS